MKLNLDFKFLDIFFTSLISLFCTVILYSFLYDKIGWNSLSDFYSGVSIYNNHNKFLDIYIYFIYLFLFFIFIPIVSYLRKKFFYIHFDVLPKFKFIEKKQNILPLLKKMQYLTVFGFIFLHPFDGNLYPKLIALIILLIIISIIDIKKREGFSAFAISAFLFIFFFNSYFVSIAPIDEHHYGEKFCAFFLHNNFNLQYYKDVMLVHGISDISSSWIGNFIFNQNNIYGYCLGEVFLKNIIFIITILTASFIFSQNISYLAPIIIQSPSSVIMSFLFYIAIIKENFIKNKVLCFWLLYIFSIAFAVYWTTIGSFWLIASIPAFVYLLIKSKNRKYMLISAVVLSIILIAINKTAIIEYLHQAKYYIKGNLYAFGNDFGNLEFNLKFLFDRFYKMFALFFTPIIIIEFIKQLQCNKKDYEKILFLLFPLIFVFISLNYTLGRLDNGIFHRLEYVSSAFLCVIVPFWIYKYSDKKIKFIIEKIMFYILIITIISTGFNNFIWNINHIGNRDYKINTTLYNTGNISIESENNKRLTEINNYLSKSKQNNNFLDMTNRGMHYLYFNKQIPVQFTSLYNSITTEQSFISLDKLEKNIPDNILIFSLNLVFDEVYPSIRINPIYRWIFLNQKYNYHKEGNNVFLVKNNKFQQYTKNELKDLDRFFSKSNLKFLPEAWAGSINKLPVKKLKADYQVKQYGNKTEIKFSNSQKVRNIDLLYLKNNEKNKLLNYKISINNSDSIIKCKSKSGEILVPMDNFPSWLLNDNLKEIIIETDKEIKSPEIEFYKKTFENMP